MLDNLIITSVQNFYQDMINLEKYSGSDSDEKQKNQILYTIVRAIIFFSKFSYIILPVLAFALAYQCARKDYDVSFLGAVIRGIIAALFSNIYLVLWFSVNVLGIPCTM